MAQGGSTGSGWVSILGWLLGIIGGIGAFVGLFIMFGDKDQYVGFGGADLSWRVGDIEPVWGYALLIGGVALVVVAVALLVVTGRASSAAAQAGTVAQARAAAQASALRDLLVHATVFVVVNAFIWLQDYGMDSSVDYAFLVTIPWGIGLAIHAVAYYVGRREEPTGTAPH